MGTNRVVYRVAAALLAAFIVVFLATTVRPWMKWGGDDALYVMSARNIALGQPRAPTLYVQNPLNPIHPASPPVGLPLLLAPVYASSGFDWAQFKLACVATFALFLAVFIVIAGEWLPALWALLAIALLGLHPYTWQLKDTIPPEFPFMFLAYGALWLVDRVSTSSTRHKVLFAIAAAVCVAGAYVTRPIGVVLLPAIVLASLWQTRRLLNAGLFIALAGLALAWCIEHLLHPDIGTYVGYLHQFGWQSLLRNLKAYNIAWRYVLEDHIYAQTPKGVALLAAALGITVLGFIIRVRARLSVFEWFALGYAGLLLIYPVSLEPDRYSYPLWPLIVLYALVGCRWIGSFLPGVLAYAPGALLAGVLVMNFSVVYPRLRGHTPANEAKAAEANSAYDYLKRHLPADAVVIARVPTAVALVAERRSAIWPEHCDDEQFRAYMSSIRAEYVLQDAEYGAEHPGKADELISFVIHNQQKLQRVFANEAFTLYRLVP